MEEQTRLKDSNSWAQAQRYPQTYQPMIMGVVRARSTLPPGHPHETDTEAGTEVEADST